MCRVPAGAVKLNAGAVFDLRGRRHQYARNGWDGAPAAKCRTGSAVGNLRKHSASSFYGALEGISARAVKLSSSANMTGSEVLKLKQVLPCLRTVKAGEMLLARTGSV